MKRLEASIERAVVAYAKSRKVLAFKIGNQGVRGIPDRMFLFQGRVLFCEMKRPGGKPSALQVLMIQTLRDAGFAAVVVDNVPLGKKLIDGLVEGLPRNTVDIDESVH